MLGLGFGLGLWWVRIIGLRVRVRARARLGIRLGLRLGLMSGLGFRV